MYESRLTPSTLKSIMRNLHNAVEAAPTWYKAWHVWASVNFELASAYDKRTQRGHSGNNSDDSILANGESAQEFVLRHAIAAVHAFFKSLSLATKNEVYVNAILIAQIS